MGTRIKTFLADGSNPNGRIFAGDLNLMQDQYADLVNLTQSLSVGSVAIGESGLQLLRFGTGEARLSGAFRTDGIVRALGGLFAGTFTTTQRNAISSPPYGLIVLNTTTNQYEWNAGTPSVPNWQPISPPAGTVGTAGIADGAVTSLKIADGTIVYADIATTLKPSSAALDTDEALRALGAGTGQALSGNGRFAMRSGVGTNNRMLQAGKVSSSGTVTVTFGIAFSSIPTVVASPLVPSNPQTYCVITAISTTQATFKTVGSGGGDVACEIQWLAEGPAN